jgi:predicted secreted protein
MKLRGLLATALVLHALTGIAAEPPVKPTGTLIDFRVDVQKSVANDLGRATAFTEMTGADPAEVARKVKAVIADGLATAKAQPGLTVRSGATHTSPLYAKGSRSIESWRMRSEIVLESRDVAVLSAVVGKLQGNLAVSNIHFAPAPETRRKAEDEATLEAIDAFRAKAGRIAAALQKPYRIRQMSVSGSGHLPQALHMSRGVAMLAESAPLPVEAGESNISMGVSGQIELLD